MDSGWSQETPGSETKCFTVHSTASGMTINIFVSVALSPKPHGGNMWWTQMTSVHRVCCTAKEELKDQECRLLEQAAASQSPLPWEQAVTRQPWYGHLDLLSCLCDQPQKLLSLRRWRSLTIWHTQQESARTLRAMADLPLLTIHSTRSWQNWNVYMDIWFCWPLWLIWQRCHSICLIQHLIKALSPIAEQQGEANLQ